MSLKLPTNFNNDIQGRDTNLIPVISITNYSQEVPFRDYLFISTTQIQLTDNSGGVVTALPLLLNIPSIKESIDIETRRYKIGSINLDISNLQYDGKRFSEIFDDSLINREIRVFWVSPSAVVPFYYDIDPAGGDNVNNRALQVYFGTIRRYTHDDDKVRLVVEDRSQATLHRDLPIANLGTGVEVPDKYKNKPIPMVYGHVDRSPCVISNAEEGDEYTVVKKLLADSDEAVDTLNSTTLVFGNGGISFTESPLYIYENGYLSLNQYLNQDSSSEKNYATYNNIVEFFGSSELAQGILSTWQLAEINKITPIYNTNTDGENGSLDFYLGGLAQDGTMSWKDMGYPTSNWSALTDRLSGSFIQIYGNQIIGATTTAINNTPYAAFRFDIKLNTSFEEINTYLIMKVVKGENNQVGWEYGNIQTTPGWQFWLNSGYEDFESSPVSDNVNNYDTGLTTDEPMVVSSHYDTTATTLGTYQIGIPINFAGAGDSGDEGDDVIVDYRFHEFHVWQDIKIDDLFNRDFYVNVNGRAGHWVQGNLIHPSPSAPQAIAHILKNELGVVNPDGTGAVTPQESGWNAWEVSPYFSWKYAFTVDKKINSKKLIEGIASASPFIPRFNNMGKFRFDVIPEDGGNVNPNNTIKYMDVIDFSYSRTKIEDVYTKIVFKYNWDYAIGEFQSSEEVTTDMILPLHDPKYYGFKIPDDGYYDHAESTLIIDDDRGKYIRHDAELHQTALNFATWFLLWSCNQKLKMKVKLPLSSGLHLEIGDLVNFDSLLGGVKPYGIDYFNGDNFNGQAVFKQFIITSTNKSLDSVEIECIQLTGLSSDIVGGCMDSNACNYNPDANTPSIECEYGTVYYRDADNDGVGDGNDQHTFCHGENTTGWTQECCDIDPDCDCPANNASCYDCNGDCNGTAVVDDCGVCGGNNQSQDDCGECGGDNATCTGCADSSALNYICDENSNNAPECCARNEAGDLTGGIGTCIACGPIDDPACCEHEGEIDMCHPLMGNSGVIDTIWGATGGALTLPIEAIKSFMGMNNPPELLTPIGTYWIPAITGVVSDPDDTMGCHPAFFPEDEIRIILDYRTMSYGSEWELGVYAAAYWDFIFSSVGNTENPESIVSDVKCRVTSTDSKVLINPDLNTISSMYIYNGQSEEFDEVTYSWGYTEVKGMFNSEASFDVGAIEDFEVFRLLPDDTTGVIVNRDYSVVIEVDITSIDAYTGYDINYIEYIPAIFEYRSCIPIGDINNDGSWSVLDIVALANCVLNDNCHASPSVPFPCAADVNGDGGYSILDIVILCNCVLGDYCGGYNPQYEP